jgi:hypothetical protein
MKRASARGSIRTASVTVPRSRMRSSGLVAPSSRRRRWATFCHPTAERSQPARDRKENDLSESGSHAEAEHKRSARKSTRRAPSKSNGSDLVSLGRRIRHANLRKEFASFCASVPIHSRKAYDLIAIANAVDAGLFQAKAVQEIGWSKARVIAQRANTKSIAQDAVAFARTNTLPAVVGLFQRNGAKTKLITKSFHLTVGQAQELETTLVDAGAQRRHGRLDNRADALMRILHEFGLSMKLRPTGTSRRR